VLIDDALHEPLEQALVVVTDDPDRVEAATAFAAFVNEVAGREVMTRFGFVLPGEDAGTG
jgi:molybdate transport system substrate-binding protein